MSLLYRRGKEAWVSVASAAYKDEEELRRFFVEDPAILRLEELPTVDSTVRVTVGREAPLGSGFADAIWVDLEGRVTILEVKLRSNPEIRREVLAQALSYAAFLEGMTVSDFADRIALPYLETHHGPSVAGLSFPEAIREVTGSDVDGEVFWDGLEQSLARGDFTILVVVDQPHDQLRRSVSYVNRHADFEIYLVEVGFYRSPDGMHEILAPRILDAVSGPGAGSAKKASQREDWNLVTFLGQSKDRYASNHDAMLRLTDELHSLEQRGLVLLGFGTGKQASLIVRSADGAASWIWVKASGSVQMPRYGLRDTGYAEEQITEFMRQVAEVSGAQPSKFASQTEPQIVSAESFGRVEVIERLLEVIRQLADERTRQLEVNSQEVVEEGD